MNTWKEEWEKRDKTTQKIKFIRRIKEKLKSLPDGGKMDIHSLLCRILCSKEDYLYLIKIMRENSKELEIKKISKLHYNKDKLRTDYKGEFFIHTNDNRVIKIY